MKSPSSLLRRNVRTRHALATWIGLAVSVTVASAQLNIPASWAYPTSDKDTSQPAFSGKISQVRQSYALLPSLPSAESLLEGTLIDPDTGQPFVSMVWTVDSPELPFLDEYPVQADGTFVETNVNYSASAADGYFVATGLGAFPNDRNFPGLPGSVDDTFFDYSNADGFAFMIRGYIELPAGPIQLGVHSDDAVELAMHPNDVRDVFRTVIAGNPTTGGLQHYSAPINVEVAGLYEVRILVSHWNGDASLELWTADPADVENTRALVNDPDDPFGLVKAYSALTTPTRPYVKSVSPTISATGVGPTEPIVAVVANPDANPIAMLVNGSAVTPVAVTNGNEITLTYTPSTPFPGGTSVEVELQYGGVSGQYTYVTRTGRKALLIGGGTSPGSGEQAIQLRLAEVFGLDTTYIEDGELAGAGGTNVAAGHVLVLNSSSVNSGQVAPHNFEELDIPLMNVESANVDDFLLADSPFGQGNNPTTVGIMLTNVTHPLAAGLAEGEITILSDNVQQHRGTSPASGIPIGYATDWESRGDASWLLYGIEAGSAVDSDGAGTMFTHPARRVHFGLMGDQGAASFTEDGWKLFDAAIGWLVPAPPAQPEMTIGAAADGNVTISWTESGTLVESDVVNGTYTESANQDNPQTIPAGADTKFYQVQQP